MIPCVTLPEDKLKSSSCADLIRASTSLDRPKAWMSTDQSPWAEGPRVEPGQDEIGRRIPFPGPRQIFPRQPCALREKVGPSPQGAGRVRVCDGICFLVTTANSPFHRGSD